MQNAAAGCLETIGSSHVPIKLIKAGHMLGLSSAVVFTPPPIYITENDIWAWKTGDQIQGTALRALLGKCEERDSELRT